MKILLSLLNHTHSKMSPRFYRPKWWSESWYCSCNQNKGKERTALGPVLLKLIKDVSEEQRFWPGQRQAWTRGFYTNPVADGSLWTRKHLGKSQQGETKQRWVHKTQLSKVPRTECSETSTRKPGVKKFEPSKAIKTLQKKKRKECYSIPEGQTSSNPL